VQCEERSSLQKDKKTDKYHRAKKDIEHREWYRTGSFPSERLGAG